MKTGGVEKHVITLNPLPPSHLGYFCFMELLSPTFLWRVLTRPLFDPEPNCVCKLTVTVLPTPVTSKPTMTTTTHVDVWRPMKHINSNGKYNTDGSNAAGTNIKHAKSHRRKFRNKQGHRSEGTGGEYEGNGEDSSADMELFQTTSPSSSAGGGWSGGNSRNYQRSAKEGSNSINSYNNNNRNSNNNNNRYNGGDAVDHPNLSSGAALRSSRLINPKFTFHGTSNYLPYQQLVTIAFRPFQLHTFTSVSFLVSILTNFFSLAMLLFHV